MLELCRQRNAYSCGPAAIVAAGQLQGIACSFEDVNAELNPHPIYGTENDDLLFFAKRHLLLSDYQEKGHGGFAIANIRNPDSGIGHYVVMLKKERNILWYYCPLHGKTISIDERKLVWTNGAGTLKDWVINLDSPLAKSTALFVHGERVTFNFCSPSQSICQNRSTGLPLNGNASGQSAFTVQAAPTEFAIIGSALYLKGIPVGARDFIFVRPELATRFEFLTSMIVKDVKQQGNSLITLATSEQEVNRCLRHIDWRFPSTKKYSVKSSNFVSHEATNHKDVLIIVRELLNSFGFVQIAADTV